MLANSSIRGLRRSAAILRCSRPMRRVYKLLVEGQIELPFFQVIAIVVRDDADLNSERMESRIRAWMSERGERLISIDHEETGPIADEHIPETIRSERAEVAPVTVRAFHPGEKQSTWRRFVRWWS
jgi:hypothetical protein